MAAVTDPEILKCYKNALANWRYTNFVVFRELAQQWVRREELTEKEVARLLHEHVDSGGDIDQQKETRPEWDDIPYHYDLRVSISGRLVYFETVLFYDDPDDPDDPTIHVVNIHDA